MTDNKSYVIKVRLACTVGYFAAAQGSNPHATYDATTFDVAAELKNARVYKNHKDAQTDIDAHALAGCAEIVEVGS